MTVRREEDTVDANQIADMILQVLGYLTLWLLLSFPFAVVIGRMLGHADDEAKAYTAMWETQMRAQYGDGFNEEVERRVQFALSRDA